ncbi:MAG TPA: hypothetical protein VGG16_04105 [Streptosporangiaceae bacterium]
MTVEPPDIETFGENVGTLTSEVFGLEVTNSGFHRMIAEAAAGQASYREVLDTFGGQPGSEARALLQALVTVQGRGYQHFTTFRLGLLYSMQAARLISGIQGRLDVLLRDGGSAAVHDHLCQEEESWQKTGLNGWQAACYGALTASDWFCAGGFRASGSKRWNVRRRWQSGRHQRKGAP